MYEWYENEGLWNIDMNRSFYEDYSIGELGIEYEYLVFENELYRITLEPLDSDHIVCFKIYKKDKPIYDICRISFFEDLYLYTSKNNNFKLNVLEEFMFNQIIDSPSIMREPIDTMNSEMKLLIFEDETQNVRNNDYEKLSKLWKPISLDQIREYRFSRS